MFDLSFTYTNVLNVLCTNVLCNVLNRVLKTVDDIHLFINSLFYSIWSILFYITKQMETWLPVCCCMVTTHFTRPSWPTRLASLMGLTASLKNVLYQPPLRFMIPPISVPQLARGTVSCITLLSLHVKLL